MENSKKEAILEAATRHFARHGFKKTSVEDIARDAGVAKGTVYLAYDSKEEIFYQAVHREMRNWVAEVAKIVDPREPADDLLGLASMTAFMYLEDHTLVRDLFSGMLDGQLPGWVARFKELRTLGCTNVIEILRLGIKQGRFREDLDVETTAMLLQDLHLVGMLMQFSSNKPFDMEMLQRRLQAGMALVLDGLRRRK